MAMRAKRNEIRKNIGFFPVAFKVAPRSNMMNIKRVTKFLFSNATFLANVIIALAGFVLLAFPVWAVPLFVTALPIAVVFTLLPSGGAFIATEATRIMSILAFYDMGSNLYDPTAPLASKQTVATLPVTFRGACMAAMTGRWNNPKLFSTHWANFIPTCAIPYIGTLIGTEAVHALFAIPKLLATCFTGLHRFSDRLTIALRRTKSLCLAVRLEQLAANLTCLFHAAIISQFGEWTSTKLRGVSNG